MKKIFILTMLFLLVCAGISAQDIAAMVKDEAEKLWTVSPGKFKETFGPPEAYKWKSRLKKDLVYKSDAEKSRLLFMEVPVTHASFRFTPKHLQGMYLTLAKQQAVSDKDAYIELVKKLKNTVREFAGLNPPKIRKRKSKGWSRYTYRGNPMNIIFHCDTAIPLTRKRISNPVELSFLFSAAFLIIPLQLKSLLKKNQKQEKLKQK